MSLTSRFCSSQGAGKHLAAVSKRPSGSWTTQPRDDTWWTQEQSQTPTHIPFPRPLDDRDVGVVRQGGNTRHAKLLAGAACRERAARRAASGHSFFWLPCCCRIARVLDLTLSIPPSALPFDWCSSARARVLCTPILAHHTFRAVL